MDHEFLHLIWPKKDRAMQRAERPKAAKDEVTAIARKSFEHSHQKMLKCLKSLGHSHERRVGAALNFQDNVSIPDEHNHIYYMFLQMKKIVVETKVFNLFSLSSSYQMLPNTLGKVAKLSAHPLKRAFGKHSCWP